MAKKAMIKGAGGRTRGDYNAYIDTLTRRRAYGGPSGTPVTQGYLRLEATLGTQGSVNFEVLNSQGTTPATTTERRLGLTDNFLVTGLSLFLLKVASGSTNQVNQLYTFPNATVFSGSGEAVNLMNIYNGSMSVKINSTTYIEALDLYRFYRVASAQKNVGLSTLEATDNPNNKYLADGWEGGDYGFYQSTPTFELSGAYKNDLQLNLPASVAMGGTSSTNYAVLYLRGFLAQNVSKIGKPNQ